MSFMLTNDSDLEKLISVIKKDLFVRKYKTVYYGDEDITSRVIPVK